MIITMIMVVCIKCICDEDEGNNKQQVNNDDKNGEGWKFPSNIMVRLPVSLVIEDRIGP